MEPGLTFLSRFHLYFYYEGPNNRPHGMVLQMFGKPYKTLIILSMSYLGIAYHSATAPYNLINELSL